MMNVAWSKTQYDFTHTEYHRPMANVAWLWYNFEEVWSVAMVWKWGIGGQGKLTLDTRSLPPAISGGARVASLRGDFAPALPV